MSWAQVADDLISTIGILGMIAIAAWVVTR